MTAGDTHPTQNLGQGTHNEFFCLPAAFATYYHRWQTTRFAAHTGRRSRRGFGEGVGRIESRSQPKESRDG